MTQEITGALFKKMLLNASIALENHKQEINELNVFPVPDGDTGTNMSLTLNAGAKALENVELDSVGKAAELTAAALLRGARGNSGVILSLLFRGLARHLKDSVTSDAYTFACALAAGVDSAYKAVMKPAEGTILTVSRLAAAGAVSVSEVASDVEVMLEQAIKTGYIALSETVNQNPVLKKAGVVDAGAKGYLYILDGMLKAIRGQVLTAEASVVSEKADFSAFSNDDITFTYCTEFIAELTVKKNVANLQDFLSKRGDSIVVVDDEEIVKVHVHTNDPGAVLTEALSYGSLRKIKIENMRLQHTETAAVASTSSDRHDVARTAEPSAAPKKPEKKHGVAVVCAGAGIEAVFRDLGVDGIITGGQTMNPSTEDILEIINATPAEIVFVLPNNKNIVMAAEQCIPLCTDKQVVVIPSRSIPQGISALLAMEPESDTAVITREMTEAAKRVRTALITLAARDSNFDGHDIKEGEYLAIIDDTLTACGQDAAVVINTVAAKLREMAPEFITVFAGEDANETDAEDIAKTLAEYSPTAETTVINGGQPVYHYIISAE